MSPCLALWPPGMWHLTADEFYQVHHSHLRVRMYNQMKPQQSLGCAQDVMCFQSAVSVVRCQIVLDSRDLCPGTESNIFACQRHADLYGRRLRCAKAFAPWHHQVAGHLSVGCHPPPPPPPPRAPGQCEGATRRDSYASI